MWSIRHFGLHWGSNPCATRSQFTDAAELNARKAGISGPFSRLLGSRARTPEWWLGRTELNLDLAISKADALACPRGFAEPHFIGIVKPLETREFREPYRIRAVQSSGENCAIRRRMGGLCRLIVRNSNQKSRPILGLVANNLAQRKGGRGEAGGGRGPGIQHSLAELLMRSRQFLSDRFTKSAWHRLNSRQFSEQSKHAPPANLKSR